LRQSPGSRHVPRLSQVRVPFLGRRYPASSVVRTPPPSAPAGAGPRGFAVDQPAADRGRRGRLPLLRTGSLPCVLPPLPRWDRRGRVSLACPSTAAFPVQLVGRLPHRTLSRPARCSLALRPAWPAGPREGPFPEVLQTIRHLLIRPGCFRLERELPGGTCTHGTSAPSQGTQLNDIERSWRDLKRHYLAHRTFRDADDLDAAIHHAVGTLNRERHVAACAVISKAA
jgi:hypothetical protein